MILQANIAGYRGTPATVIGYIDFDTQLLYIKGVAKLKNDRFQDDTGFISNVTTDDFDYFFSEDDFGRAFREYRQFDGSNKLYFESDAKRAIPNVEINKIGENGTDYLISPDTTNEHIAVLAICLLARKAIEVNTTNEMYETLDEFFTI